MDVFRIEAEGDDWILYKVHGYKPIVRSGNQADLFDHVQVLTHGKGAVIRFWAEAGVRELRVGVVHEEEQAISADLNHN